jgi:hypothetical protein
MKVNGNFDFSQKSTVTFFIVFSLLLHKYSGYSYINKFQVNIYISNKVMIILLLSQIDWFAKLSIRVIQIIQIGKEGTSWH